LPKKAGGSGLSLTYGGDRQERRPSAVRQLILYSCGSIVCEPGRLAGMPLFRLLYTSDGEHRIETAEGKGVGQRRSNLQ
jgi:hypothetical protein